MRAKKLESVAKFNPPGITHSIRNTYYPDWIKLYYPARHLPGGVFYGLEGMINYPSSAKIYKSVLRQGVLVKKIENKPLTINTLENK